MRLTFELLLFQAKPLGNLDRAVFLKKWDQNHVEKRQSPFEVLQTAIVVVLGTLEFRFLE